MPFQKVPASLVDVPVTSVAGRTGAIALTSADITGLGSAAILSAGTAAGNLVQLDGAAKLPAVDGSQLTNLPSGGSNFATIAIAGQGSVVADSGNDTLTLVAGTNITLTTDATTDTITIAASGGAAGEANTASNVGPAGIGLFKQKSGTDLQFKTLNAGSAKVSLTDDTANSEVDVDIVESALTLGNLGGTLPLAKGGTSATTASAARTNLGLAIGSDVQAYGATLQSLSALGTAADRIAYSSGAATWAETTLTAFGRSLLDDADAAAGRATLGLVIGTHVQGFDSSTAKTNIAQVFAAAQRSTVTTLSDATTVTPDFAVSNDFTITLGGNRTLANPTNLAAGQSGVVAVVQDATGGRTLAWGSYWKFEGGAAPTLSTAANAIDVVAYWVRSTTSIVATLSVKGAA